MRTDPEIMPEPICNLANANMSAFTLDGHSTYLQTRKFESLDGLRCFCILGVIWHHATGVGRGNLGVQLFFVISGFLITTLLLRERRNFGSISLGKFYARRSLRIFPLYYTVLAIYIGLVFISERHDPVGKDFIYHLRFFATYTSNWFVPLDGRVIFYFAWSLATEEQFYMVMPWIEKYLKVLAVPAIILILGLHIASSWISLGVAVQKVSTALCLGVLLAHALDHAKTFKLVAAMTYPRFSCVVWLAAFLGLAWVEASELLIAAALMGLLSACVIRRGHVLAWLLDWKPLQSIGRVSYGMYMLHQLCLNLLKKLTSAHGPTLFVCGSIVTYGVALASFRWYESIFLRMKERYAIPHAVRPDRVA